MTMKKNILMIASVVLSGAMLSCSSSNVTEDYGTQKVVYMLSDPQPIQLTGAQRVFANDNNQFTLNFLKTVNDVDQSGKSFIYSPLSITYVLGMVNDAATGETEKELEQTLGFHEGGIKAVNEYCKKLIEGLPKVDQDVTLNIANALFVNKNYTLKNQFQQNMQTYYGAKAETLDFSSSQTLDHINGWCKDKTNGMIPTILDKVEPDIMSYLLNAIYFKADWTSKFDPKNSKTETFTTTSSEVQLPMMHQNVLISYMKNDTYSAVEMPYGNGYWKMAVMLPEEGKTTDNIIERLKNYGLEGHEGALYGDMVYPGSNDDKVEHSTWSYMPNEVDLKLPRFETSSDTDELDMKDGLVGFMQKMGIHRAFIDGLAEIPNMCEVPVFIGMMRQKAKIKVNEEGSEAAAVTVGGMIEATSISPREYPKATFHANRPFVYVITEASSGVILFVGKFTGQ